MEKEVKKVEEKKEAKKIEKTRLAEMTKENKKLLTIAIIVVAVIFIASLLIGLLSKSTSNDTKAEGTKAITAAGIIKDETYKELKFSNTTLIKENDIYTLSMEVTNTGTETSKTIEVDIPIKDKNDNTIITLLGYIGQELPAKGSTTISASTSADLSDAYSKEIVERKTE